ncbi:hypothetical protein [Microvirga pudoricolor]|uniref:hypothetical protein n=1 Tax=Microvirga pudoricolor TaxID=2778729 RepID=UPI00194FCCF9|nr:hypothetical protein [Microvirga pudoricolor]MBM6593410.1 hypothetical protein [Microvirga pudoricolor]
MGFSDMISKMAPGKRRAEKAKAANAELRSNAEKALRMKQEHDEHTPVPPHRTAHEGMQAKTGQADPGRARETNFTTQMGRSAGGRAGDAS